MPNSIKIILLLVLLAVSYGIFSAKSTGNFVQIGNTRIPVEIADTKEERDKGLSERRSLSKESGMLFVFDESEAYRFWMPNMHFPLDIIWIANGKVIGIEENIPPETDLNNPHFYKPPLPIDHAIEVNEGFSKVHAVKVGDIIVYCSAEKNPPTTADFICKLL